MSASITFYSLSDYNNGDLIAKTFDLEELPDYASLSEARTEWLEELTEELDDGELREEYIVADFEGIPSELVGEYDLDRDFGDYFEAIDEWDKEVVDAAMECDIPLESIGDAYVGSFSSDTELAEEYVDSTGMLDGVPDALQRYFDMKSFARDLMFDHTSSNGHYFHDNY